MDFKLQVTRDEFEKLCSDLFERVKAPILTALKISGLSMEIMNQVTVCIILLSGEVLWRTVVGQMMSL